MLPVRPAHALPIRPAAEGVPVSHKPILPGPIAHPMARPSQHTPAPSHAVGPKGPRRRGAAVLDEPTTEAQGYSEKNADKLEHDEVREGRPAAPQHLPPERSVSGERPAAKEPGASSSDGAQRQPQGNGRSVWAHSPPAPSQKGFDGFRRTATGQTVPAQRAGAANTASIAASSQQKIAIAALLTRFDNTPALSRAKQAVGSFHAQMQWAGAMAAPGPLPSRELIDSWLKKHEGSPELAQAQAALAAFGAKNE